MLILIGLLVEWLPQLRIRVDVAGVGPLLLLVIFRVVIYCRGLTTILISVSSSLLIVLAGTLIMVVLADG